MAKIIKDIGKGKRGRTLQGYRMDVWLKHRELINKICSDDDRTSALVSGNK